MDGQQRERARDNDWHHDLDLASYFHRDRYCDLYPYHFAGLFTCLGR